MKHSWMTALCLLVVLAFPAEASLLAFAYKAVPCWNYAPGCSTMPTDVPDDLEFDRFAWTTFWHDIYGGDYVGAMTPIDTNSAGWIVGRVDVTLWTHNDIENFGPWDGVTINEQAGETGFVYRAHVGAICCTTDYPFQIFAVDDLGFIYTNDAYGGGLYHVSAVDSGLGNPLIPIVVGPFPEDWFMHTQGVGLAYVGRDAYGTFFVMSTWEGNSPRWALVPIPEPGTLVMRLAGLGVVYALRRQHRVR